MTPAELHAALGRRPIRADARVVELRPKPEARFTTVKQVATVLGVSQMTVRRLIESGQLRGHQFGRSVRIRLDDLSDYLRRSELDADWRA